MIHPNHIQTKKEHRKKNNKRKKHDSFRITSHNSDISVDQNGIKYTSLLKGKLTIY